MKRLRELETEKREAEVDVRGQGVLKPSVGYQQPRKVVLNSPLRVEDRVSSDLHVVKTVANTPPRRQRRLETTGGTPANRLRESGYLAKTQTGIALNGKKWQRQEEFNAYIRYRRAMCYSRDAFLE